MNHLNRIPGLLFSFIFVSFTCSAQLQLNSTHQVMSTKTLISSSANSRTPAKKNVDFTDDWYQSAVANLKQLEYNFYAVSDAQCYKVTNLQQRISFQTNPANYKVRSVKQQAGEPDWEIDFAIRGIGRDQLTWTPGRVTAINNEPGMLTYQYDGVGIEYVNTAAGLRQNFRIAKRLPGKDVLRVSMKLTGDLSPELVNNKISFSTRNDTASKIVYSDLKAWDANHTLLPSHMEYNKSIKELNLVVDDSKAVYPILVDPITQSPEWNSSVDGLLASLLTNIQMKTALYGFTVTSLGDVNGDTYADVAISAPALVDIFSGSGTVAAVGAVFVYYGSFSGLPATPSKILQPNTAVAGALFGFSVDAGDVAGDGRNDIIIGAPLDKYSVHVQTAVLGGGPLGLNPLYADLEVKAGKVYAYRGEDLATGTNPTSFLDVKLASSFFSPGLLGLLGSNISVNALFGFSVAVTDDLNGDGKGDIVVGAPAYLGTNLLSVQNGNAFVYYSNNLGTATPVQLTVPTPSLLGLISLPVLSTSSLLFGYSVDGVGDYNNDGFADVVVGAPAGVDLSSLGGIFSGQVLGGSAYVYYGNGSGINSAIGARMQASASGLLGNAANLFGFKVKGMKNINGQHNGNIIIGAPVGGLIPPALSLSIRSGNIHVFNKKTSSPAGVVTANQVIESPKSSSLLQLLNTMQLNVLFGASFDNAYDINCDSYPDIVVGEPLSTGLNIAQLQTSPVGGAVYIYYGMSDGSFNPAPVYNVAATYGGDFLSVNASALFGWSVAGLPKLNGPSAKPRIIVGSPSGSLDFGSSMLNLGATLNMLLSFAAGDNGLGKGYTFDPGLCAANHTLATKLFQFTGQKVEKTVLLNWVATAEDNLSQYVLEKSVDGTNFGTMAYIFAKGNPAKNTYSLIDYHPVPNTNYYRLRMIEKDNKFFYSEVIRVKFDEQVKGEVIIAPNPVENEFKVLLNGLEPGVYTLEVKNTSGQSIQKKTITVGQNEHIETMSKTNSMSTGIYYLNVYGQNNKQVKVINFMVK